MLKTSTLTTSRRSLLEFVTGNHAACALLTVGLFAAGCSDDFAKVEGDTSTNSDTTSSGRSTSHPASTSSAQSTRPSSTQGSNTGAVSDSNAGLSDASGGDADASVVEPGPKPPMNGSSSDDPRARDCGKAGQACCDDEVCERGFTCTSEGDAATGSSLSCVRDGAPPAPDGDAAAPGMPPRPEDDTDPPGPPGNPPRPGDDAGPVNPPAPDEACGALGEQCCPGPGGRCDEGLSCDNSNGPELDDSKCVTAT